MTLLSRALRAASLPFVLVGLSACQLELIEYGDRLEAERSMASRIQDMHPTAFHAVPVSGSAIFTGTGNLYIDRVRDAQGDGIFVLGDARLTADFANETITGEITDLVAATNVRLNDAGNVILSGVDAMDVSGSLLLGADESVVGIGDGTRTSRPNDWFADYAGTITADGVEYLIDGEIDGQFYGTRVNNPNTDVGTKALAGIEELYSGSTATRVSDVAEFDANLAIVAEHDYRENP